MSETLTTARRAMLHRRVRFIVGFTITYNVIEAIVAVWAGVLASSAALVVAVLAVREGLEAWRGDVESPFEVLEDLEDD
ncbi:hypothetical protein HMPREF2528_05005 [Rothia sp. HMSC078H08]|uniref:hypothetical protein n=1 Tax=Rothia sp. HMSC078H08 TaxID=1715008 RepID=UPI0008C25E29|nr:hypothetical protein [Rothia sp. HMSC078H08]OFN72439.1 hypothetical protein HMPREF2528_05005 [Rothia sp. HMSC078H08]